MPALVDQRCVRLRDGRRLAYTSAGPPDGSLVLYLHGAIGSPQRVCPELEAVVSGLGIRYVMVSRPGFGRSDPLPGRTLRDFAADAAAVADQLGRERFSVVGVSAGGPYALACAHELPHRVAVASVVSSMPWACSPDRVDGLSLGLRAGLRALRRCPRTCTRTGDALLGLARRHPRLVAHTIRAGATPADRRELAHIPAPDDATARFLDTAGRGVGAMVEDYGLCARPWGFAVQDIRTPVQLWHGAQDPLVPVDQAAALAAALPLVDVTFDPDAGHFFYRRRLGDILGALVGALPARRWQAVG
jgi:pimeloyl-ACP methyl ester carboxylesterase